MRQFLVGGLVGSALLVVGCSGGVGAGASSRDFARDGEEPGAAAVSGGKGSSSGSSDAAGPFPTLAPGVGSSPSAGSSTPGDATPSDPSAPSVSRETGQGRAEAGILTAGVWDDNRNFDRFLGYRSALVATGLPGLLPISESELQIAHGLWLATPAAKETLDVSLIIDTTGSMGDEIAYLQSEFSALSNKITERHPNAHQRWSLVVYKDTVDQYITRWFDFRDDPEEFRAHLAQQSAEGGGDFPESPERGFEVAEQLSWRAEPATAKLAFWVADAPHHNDRALQMADSVRAMQRLGVHVYPVASSGVDELTELSMRTAAALTGGRYLFLTNDSGVGGDHKEPTVPCYFVTKLDTAILRMVDVELSGTYREPDAAEVMRTGGNPKDGACTLESGETVHVF